MKNGLPESTWQSVLFTVVAYTFISTSSSFGVGISSSLIVRSPGKPYFERTAAFILLYNINNHAQRARIADCAKRARRIMPDGYRYQTLSEQRNALAA